MHSPARVHGAALAAAVVALLVGAAAGCDDFPETLQCQRSEQCVRGDTAGRCLDPGYCAFPDARCPSGMRWDDTSEVGAGSCVEGAVDGGAGMDASGRLDGGGRRDAGSGVDGGPGFDAGTGSTNACGGTAVLPGAPGDPCGNCDLGTYRCDGPDALECDGEPVLMESIAFDGEPWATSTYSASFNPRLAIDGDLTTSWFSAGPEPGGVPTEYVWDSIIDECIANVTVTGNGSHANPSFRTGYGFGSVTILVVDADDRIVWSEVEPLPGTPDPEIRVSPGVVGRLVVLQFTGHEAGDCGGFSELGVEVYY